MTDEPKLYTQREMDDVLEFKNAAIERLQLTIDESAELVNNSLGFSKLIRTVQEQRDAARELADQLANAIAKVMPDEPESYRTEAYEAWMDTWQRCARALSLHDCRDWKSAISPPGSGLDGLQADIDRTDA